MSSSLMRIFSIFLSPKGLVPSLLENWLECFVFFLMKFKIIKEMTKNEQNVK